MPDCHDILDHLYEYINAHDITPQLSGEIKKHLEMCRACFTRYEFEQKLLEHLKRASGCSCPDSLKKKIKILVDQF